MSCVFCMVGFFACTSLLFLDPVSFFFGCRFTAQQPHGLLHRAFSVFLFDSRGRLLLQRRASHKKTFASVWTNTCCSHPLHGLSPDEVDDASLVASSGRAPGAELAAARKLPQELGVNPLEIDSMAYLTRLHYCASDPAGTGFGEHEMDYVLVARGEPRVEPNPDEVDDVRYVTPLELRNMMDPASGLLWSPWFRIIAAELLPEWWKRLDEASVAARGIARPADIVRFGLPNDVSAWARAAEQGRKTAQVAAAGNGGAHGR